MDESIDGVSTDASDSFAMSSSSESASPAPRIRSVLEVLGSRFKSERSKGQKLIVTASPGDVTPNGHRDVIPRGQDDLPLGSDANSLADQSTTTDSAGHESGDSPSHWQTTAAKTMTSWPSFNSDVSNQTSCSSASIDYLLQGRNFDSEQLLYSLGFGGHHTGGYMAPLSRVPERFLTHPSVAHGISAQPSLDDDVDDVDEAAAEEEVEEEAASARAVSPASQAGKTEPAPQKKRTGIWTLARTMSVMRRSAGHSPASQSGNVSPASRGGVASILLPVNQMALASQGYYKRQGWPKGSFLEPPEGTSKSPPSKDAASKRRQFSSKARSVRNWSLCSDSETPDRHTDHGEAGANGQWVTRSMDDLLAGEAVPRRDTCSSLDFDTSLRSFGRGTYFSTTTESSTDSLDTPIFDERAFEEIRRQYQEKQRKDRASSEDLFFPHRVEDSRDVRDEGETNVDLLAPQEQSSQNYFISPANSRQSTVEKQPTLRDQVSFAVEDLEVIRSKLGVNVDDNNGYVSDTDSPVTSRKTEEGGNLFPKSHVDANHNNEVKIVVSETEPVDWSTQLGEAGDPVSGMSAVHLTVRGLQRASSDSGSSCSDVTLLASRAHSLNDVTTSSVACQTSDLDSDLDPDLAGSDVHGEAGVGIERTADRQKRSDNGQRLTNNRSKHLTTQDCSTSRPVVQLSSLAPSINPIELMKRLHGSQEELSRMGSVQSDSSGFCEADPVIETVSLWPRVSKMGLMGSSSETESGGTLASSSATTIRKTGTATQTSLENDKVTGPSAETISSSTESSVPSESVSAGSRKTTKYVSTCFIPVLGKTPGSNQDHHSLRNVPNSRSDHHSSTNSPNDRLDHQSSTNVPNYIYNSNPNPNYINNQRNNLPQTIYFSDEDDNYNSRRLRDNAVYPADASPPLEDSVIPFDYGDSRSFLYQTRQYENIPFSRSGCRGHMNSSNFSRSTANSLGSPSYNKPAFLDYPRSQRSRPHQHRTGYKDSRTGRESSGRNNASLSEELSQVAYSRRDLSDDSVGRPRKSSDISEISSHSNLSGKHVTTINLSPNPTIRQSYTNLDNLSALKIKEGEASDLPLAGNLSSGIVYTKHSTPQDSRTERQKSCDIVDDDSIFGSQTESGFTSSRRNHSSRSQRLGSFSRRNHPPTEVFSPLQRASQWADQHPPTPGVPYPSSLPYHPRVSDESFSSIAETGSDLSSMSTPEHPGVMDGRKLARLINKPMIYKGKQVVSSPYRPRRTFREWPHLSKKKQLAEENRLLQFAVQKYKTELSVMEADLGRRALAAYDVLSQQERDQVDEVEVLYAQVRGQILELEHQLLDRVKSVHAGNDFHSLMSSIGVLGKMISLIAEQSHHQQLTDGEMTDEELVTSPVELLSQSLTGPGQSLYITRRGPSRTGGRGVSTSGLVCGPNSISSPNLPSDFNSSLEQIKKSLMSQVEQKLEASNLKFQADLQNKDDEIRKLKHQIESVSTPSTPRTTRWVPKSNNYRRRSKSQEFLDDLTLKLNNKARVVNNEIVQETDV